MNRVLAVTVSLIVASQGALATDTPVGKKIENFKRIIVGYFITSIIGGLAPFCLLFGLAYLLPRRAELAKTGPLFAIMGWTAFILSAVYCLLILVFLAASGLFH